MMKSFKIIPILGRKTDVSQDDLSLFKFLDESTALTYDVGGINFDLERRKNACLKSYGYVYWANSATAQATKCLGLFELYDGTNRDHCIFDNGKFYVYDSSLDPTDKTAGGVTHATGDADLYSAIRVGSYVVFADRAEHTPYAWKNGDANAAKLISGGTEFKFRYLSYFMRRIIGLYSDQSNGDIDIRWSGALPTPTSACEFAAANQLYAPSDDPIVGAKTMGRNKCYVYQENSIAELAYYPDYSSPFRVFTVVSGEGCGGHHSIVSTGNAHYFFNKNYGFCKYTGGQEILPISNDIESDLQGINSGAYGAIVGTFVPLTQSIVWAVPIGGETTPDYLLFYNIDTGQWRFENKVMRYVDNWQMYEDFTWNDLVAEIGGTGVWTDCGARTWAYYTAERQRLVYANTDGKLYYHSSNALNATDIDGYRIEPIMDFGNKGKRDILQEIWFDLVETGSYSIDVYHRGGSTAGEVDAASWTSLGSVSLDSPDYPVVRLSENYKLHQIKWGTDLKDEKFAVNGITFKYIGEGSY